MATTTGPVLAAGGVTLFNMLVLNDVPVWGADGQPSQPMRVAVGTGIAALGFALWEKPMPRTAAAVAWLVLLTVLLVRVDPRTPSPLETLSDWYGK